ncbi:unnamed protein product [Bursaphelenchus okinawaensis]|uniref:Uncharacterized protein n=1 Tax=Bursaphelenchus okinawaensis TaxID=465554 RepID=A0A811LJP8_9BILA|nr:unnamed protein product [Bursaphelenchus okinawaensis]CAG9124911.1 unnamed protein product [Bursaphelenchus okinawaensis]
MRSLILLLVITTTSTSFGKHHLNKLRKVQLNVDETALRDVEKSYFTQKLDHFDLKNKDEWKQKYYVNNVNYEDGGPEFLYIGGEGPEHGYYISSRSNLNVWSERMKARMWSLEHRFYGESHPKPTQTTENLKYLTSQQALADLANFIRSKNDELQLTNPKWVVFGGSYPGALALWFRVLYPELTVGAVGSSAPIDIQMDFYGYLRVCQDSYRSYSEKCADNIGKAFTHLQQLMDDRKGRNRLEAALHVKPLFEYQNLTFTDLENFYLNVIESFQGAVQYNRVNGGIYELAASIPDVCEIMEEPEGFPVNYLIKVYQYISQYEGRDPNVFNDDYNNMIKELQNPEFHPRSEERSWIWQTCNEFGYFQTTAFEKNIFGTGAPADYYYDMCTDIFGKEYNVDYVKAATRRTQDFYGEADEYNGTHVVIPNGSIDPWHALGTYANSSELDQYSYLISGSAHCADMCPPNEADVPGLDHIRSVIFEKLQEWTGNSRFSYDNDVNNTEEHIEQNDSDGDRRLLVKKEEIDVNNVCFGCAGKEKSYSNKEISRLEELQSIRKIMPLHRTKNLVFENDSDYPDASTFTQVADHFDDENNETFVQLNEKYYKEGGPLFLYIEGEAPLGTDMVYDEDLPLVQYAKEVNAAVYGLEHRDYGDSNVTEDLSLENLKYLTSQQALADIANFIKTINKAKGYKNPKWITFGGSYAGALSAWFRKVYPELTVGTIGSSGPVEAKVDYFEYMQVVENSTRNCIDKVKQGVDTLQKNITSVEGRKLLVEKLNIQGDIQKFEAEYLDTFDEMAFFDNLIGEFAFEVQYNPHGPHSQIDVLCLLWNNDTKDIYEKIGQTSTLFSFDYEQILELFKGTEPDNFYRAWIWQTCNEFGYYQSTDIGYNAFGSSLPINYYIEWCHRAYNSSFTRDKLEENIKKTQKFYGEEDVRSFLVEGTSHCADMRPANEYDPPSLTEARQLILETIKRWIK